jgi:hypothetical protein
MTSAANFTKTLGADVGDFAFVCTLTASGQSAFGVHLSVVESSALERVYRITIPYDATGGVWKRLVPIDRTEPNTTWAVDLLSVYSDAMLRVVRVKAGLSASLQCKVVVYSAPGSSTTIVDSQVAGSFASSNAGVYDGALITRVDGNVGIGTDTPSHALDVSGNTNVSGVYKIAGSVVLSATALGPSVTSSSLTSLGALQTLQISGNASLTGLPYQPSSNAVVYFDSMTGGLAYGPSAAGPQGPQGPDGPVGSNGLQGPTGPQGPAGAPGGQSLFSTQSVRTTSAASSSTTTVVYLTRILAVGTWAVWASGTFSTSSAARLITIRLRRDIDNFNFDTKTMQPWTNGSTYTFNYSLQGLVTWTGPGSSFEVSITFNSNGDYTTNLYTATLLCIKLA